MQNLKRLIKAVLLLLLCFCSLLILYILFNLNIFHRTKPLSKSELQVYASHVYPSGPLQYVAEKFDSHSVVFLGELHKRKQDLAFFKELITYLYYKKNIKTIGWEFGAADYQNDADSIVTAPEFDRDKAIALMRNTYYAWCYEDYLDVFKTIWQLNKLIPQDSNKVRFLQLNKPYVPKRWDSPIDTIRSNERKTNFDNILPRIVEKEVIDKNKKILIYCGLHHSFTKFKTPKFFFVKDNDGRAGQRLYEKFPDKVFQIYMLSTAPSRWTMYKYITKSKDVLYNVFPFDGVFNQLYDTLKRPFAIDADNSFFQTQKIITAFMPLTNLMESSCKTFVMELLCSRHLTKYNLSILFRTGRQLKRN